MRNEIVNTIVTAGRRHCTVVITYRDATGAITVRETEPYEVRNGLYWAYCLLRQDTRRFIVKSILSARPTRRSYRPRYDLKL